MNKFVSIICVCLILPNFLRAHQSVVSQGALQVPRVSIITSLFIRPADKGIYLEKFLCETVQSTIFNQCELILIDANSPESEQEVIKKYMDAYDNIIYVKLNFDPGVYAVWNLGIAMARASYVTNANIDDCVSYDCYERHAKMLDENPEVDLVYSDYLITDNPHDTFYSADQNRFHAKPEFSRSATWRDICLPNNHPMWRKSMHLKYGKFDDRFKSAGDLEMWLRAVSRGAKFKKVPAVLGMYYCNPNGISTNPNTVGDREAAVIRRYYYPYFN